MDELLLTDEELRKVCGWESVAGIDDYERDIAKAQLGKCKNIVRHELISQLQEKMVSLDRPVPHYLITQENWNEITTRRQC